MLDFRGPDKDKPRQDNQTKRTEKATKDPECVDNDGKIRVRDNSGTIRMIQNDSDIAKFNFQ